MKGLAAALLEGAAAARAAGCEDWFLADAGATLAEADERLVDRLLRGQPRSCRAPRARARLTRPSCCASSASSRA